LLVLRDVSFGFGHKLLIKNLSFEVRAGEMLLVTGPNGSGKSTCLSLIAGLRQPLNGTVAWNDQADEVRKHSAILLAENNGHYLKLDATENLSFWVKLFKSKTSSREDIIATLTRWNLGHPLIRQGLPVERFSTGMKRRLALARLEISGAPLWILDEPLHGLDRDGIATFVSALRAHQEQGGMTVVVSHDLTPFEQLKHRRLDSADFFPQSKGTA